MDSIEFKNNVINIRLKDKNVYRLLEVTHDRNVIHQCVVQCFATQKIKLVNECDVHHPELVLDTPENREEGGDYDALFDDANYLVIQA
jgi:hypothetical protein